MTKSTLKFLLGNRKHTLGERSFSGGYNPSQNKHFETKLTKTTGNHKLVFFEDYSDKSKKNKGSSVTDYKSQRKGCIHTIPRGKLMLFPDLAEQSGIERGEETELPCHIRRVAS